MIIKININNSQSTKTKINTQSYQLKFAVQHSFGSGQFVYQDIQPMLHVQNEEENDKSKENNLNKYLPLQISPIQFKFMDEKSASPQKSHVITLKNKQIKKYQVLQSPKHKMTQIISNLKSSNIFGKFQRQKRQALKKQWRILRQQKNNDERKEQMKKRLKNLKTLDIQMNQNLSATYNKQFKTQKQINRKNTELGIHHQDDQNDQSNQIKKQQYLSRCDKEKSKSHLSYFNLDGRYNNKYQNVYKILSQSSHKEQKRRSLTQQIRQICNKQQAQKEEYMRKKSIKSQKNNHEQKKHHQNKFITNLKLKNHINMSKSVMVQKIINLRKIFNGKFKRNDDLSNNGHFGNQSQKTHNNSNEMTSTINNQNSLHNVTLSAFNNTQGDKKMSFQQLFDYQRKKMQNLKKFISDVNFNKRTHQEFNSLEVICPNDTQNVISLNNTIDQDSLNQDLLFNHTYSINLTQNLKFKQPKWEQIENKLLQRVRSQSLDQDESFFNPGSLEKRCGQQNGIALRSKDFSCSNFDYLKRDPHSNITTYNFDHIRKRSTQKPEIKLLRHKYLYSNNNQKRISMNKRRLSKQQFNKYGISVVSVSEKDQPSKKDRRSKCSKESLGNQFLQIERKTAHQTMKRVQMTAVKFSGLKEKANIKLKTKGSQKLRSQRKKISLSSFQPWQQVKTGSSPAGDDFCQFQ